MTIRLAEGLARFVVEPSEESWAEVVSAWNGVVHVSHNNGLFLTKFASQNFFDRVMIAPVCGFVRQPVVSLVFERPRKFPRRVARRWRSAIRGQPPNERGVLEYAARYYFLRGALVVQVACPEANRPWGMHYAAEQDEMADSDIAFLQEQPTEYSEGFDGDRDAVRFTMRTGTEFVGLVNGREILLPPIIQDDSAEEESE
jgi:hypothetical protein